MATRPILNMRVIFPFSGDECASMVTMILTILASPAQDC